MIAEVTKKSDGSLSYRNLAGANSDGLPLGTIIAIHRTTCPAGFLPCTGVQYDTEQYPALYLLLGTNVTPDLREANLVGIGLSSREAIQNHDVYTLGQFKDDQVQLAPSGIATNGTEGNAVGVIYSDVLGNSPESYPIRTGTVTHGKNYGVNYVIKAHTGLVESSDLSLYDEIVAYVDEHYAHDDLINLYNGALIKYDSSTQTYVPVTAPTTNNSVLTATVNSSNLWTKDNVTYYNADMTEAEAPESEAAQSVVVGYTDSSNITVTNQTTGSIWAAGTYYWDNSGQKADPLPGRMTKSYIISNTAKVLGDHIYDTGTDGTNYYEAIGLNSQRTILSDELPSATVIAELADIEAEDLYYQEITDYEYGTVTGYTATGLTTTPTSTAIDTSTVQAVYCKTYYGTDYDYEWKESSASTGIAFIGTEEEYKVAKLIPEGQAGHIPSGAMIVITDGTDDVYGEDAQ